MTATAATSEHHCRHYANPQPAVQAHVADPKNDAAALSRPIERRRTAGATTTAAWLALAICTSLHAALAFDDEDSRFGHGMGDVLVAGVGVADAAGYESLNPFLTALPVVYVDGAIEDDEDFGAVVDVPDYGRSVQ